jgi:hypothetical protein
MGNRRRDQPDRRRSFVLCLQSRDQRMGPLIRVGKQRSVSCSSLRTTLGFPSGLVCIAAKRRLNERKSTGTKIHRLIL